MCYVLYVYRNSLTELCCFEWSVTYRMTENVLITQKQFKINLKTARPTAHALSCVLSCSLSLSHPPLSPSYIDILKQLLLAAKGFQMLLHQNKTITQTHKLFIFLNLMLDVTCHFLIYKKLYYINNLIQAQWSLKDVRFQVSKVITWQC